ncbi:hypothetical protein EV645_6522 [Kribbella rubisoli]|uniref:Uncharacterized protein n=1 Tax=Kribbella rubisoli TaxID=3075929 RepID=A0A4V2FWV9_9ACTN|nr:hypothetical protein [Kribbella rubisoli]RZU11356.1 hypothetical protein EV645_6522 [Kribbella rubisoli]
MSTLTQPAAVTALPLAGHHPLALRTPWYQCERLRIDRFDPVAVKPTIQMYDTADLVQRMIADPRDSLVFGAEDEWTVTVSRPLSEQKAGTGRMRFASHSFVRMGTRKLFQPSHDRFYAVVVEVFCDHDGLPRPNPADEFTMAFAVRRQTTSTRLTERQVRRMARDVLRSRTVAHAPVPELSPAVLLPPGKQAWMTNRLGGQGWVDVDRDGRPLPDRPITAAERLDLEDALAEVLVPMWRIPTSSALCDAARTRSLWFGVVPTYSGDHGTAFDHAIPVRGTVGQPRYDDLATYEIVCRALRPAPEPCPPDIYWSAPSEPYRLAAFFDPEGTKNHKVSISMPDFRALAARAGQPSTGGVAITSPPASQLSFDPDNGSPSGGTVGGTVAQTCTFALELFAIVGFFVFSLFLPVVVLVFQLWWLLLLKVCLPPSAQAMNVLRDHFDTDGGTLATLATAKDGTKTAAARDTLDSLLGFRGTARIARPESRFEPANARTLIDALGPQEDDAKALVSESKPPDPLCSDPDGRR